MNEVRVMPVEGLPEVVGGDDIGGMIAAAAGRLENDDVVVVAQKIVSKAEGRFAPAAGRRAEVLRESVRILRQSRDTVISETRHGFVCANAGVDASNVPGDAVLLLPLDPDRSARRIRARIERAAGVRVGVVVSDTFGRPWRLGQTNVAIGVAGFDPFVDYRGAVDEQGRELSATRICVADEIAGAAEMVMGKTDRVPVVVVRGVRLTAGASGARAIVRPPEEDLFR